MEQKIAGVFINAARGVPSSLGEAAKKKAGKLASTAGPLAPNGARPQTD